MVLWVIRHRCVIVPVAVLVHAVVQSAVSGLQHQTHALVDNVLRARTDGVQVGQRTFDLFRADRGWKSPVIHLLSPRTGGNVMAIHTVSEPFAYRVLPDRALASGHSGIGRLGADEWAAIHYAGMAPTTWLTGMPVLFLLWPGKQGAESSARFEALVEGVQEAEARVFLEQALDDKRLPADLAKRIADVLSANQQETGFRGGTLCVHELERYHVGWQERSARLYRLASDVAAAVVPAPAK
jgi:hypothetical protein